MLLVLVVFLFNRAAMRDVMERTELVDVLQRSMDTAIGREQPPRLPAGGPAPAPASDSERSAPILAMEPEPAPAPALPAPSTPTDFDRAPSPEPEPEPAELRQPSAAPEAAPRQEDAPVTARTAAPAADTGRDRKPAAPAAPAREHRLYFAEVDPSGGISVTGVTRAAGPTGAPLTEALVTLLAGPDPAESKRGLITLIPPAVTLNRVYIRERVAYIDVSESFRFNRLGREGLSIQLQQVVYSATQFPNVEQVQILIDGERIDYLASEGTFVGQPIGRAAFQ